MKLLEKTRKIKKKIIMTVGQGFFVCLLSVIKTKNCITE